MQTQTPTFDTECISEIYPTIKGNCIRGFIDVYDEKYNLLKSITVTGEKFFINLEELDFKALLIKNRGAGYTTSNFSNILVKCHEALPCINKFKNNDCSCTKQI